MDHTMRTILRNIVNLPQEMIDKVEALGIHTLDDFQQAKKHLQSIAVGRKKHLHLFETLDKSVCRKLFVLAELMGRETNMNNLTPGFFNNVHEQHMEFLHICDVVTIPPGSRLRLLHRGIYTPEDIRNIQPALFLQEFHIDTGTGTYKKLILIQTWLRRNPNGNVLEDFNDEVFDELEIENDGFKCILKVVGISDEDRYKLEDFGYCTTRHIREMKDRFDNDDIMFESELSQIQNGQRLQVVSQWMHDHPDAIISDVFNEDFFTNLVASDVMQLID